MSALENPMPAAWQDPWGVSASAAVAVSTTMPMEHHHMNHNMHQHHPIPHHHIQHQQLHFQQQQLQQQQDFYQSPLPKDVNNTSSSGTENSSVSSSGGNKNANVSGAKRTVNFKLEIKPDPEEATQSPQSVPPAAPVPPQKVPSISDLSDPDSSLDIPVQVKKKIAIEILICTVYVKTSLPPRWEALLSFARLFTMSCER